MRKLLVQVFTLLILVSCHAQSKKYSYENIKIHGYNFKQLTIFVDKKTGDTLEIEGLMDVRTLIDGVPCEPEVSFTGDWTLSRFTLAEEHTFNGYILPAGTGIELKISIQPLKMHYFALRGSKNYAVNMCNFLADPVIDGVVYDHEYPVFFRKDWIFLGGILAEDDTIAGNIFPTATYVRHDDDGSIHCFCPSDPVVQGYQCSGTDYNRFLWTGGTGIILYPGGNLKYFQPVDEIEIGGVHCRPSASRGGVTLYENGRLKECTSARDQTIDGVFCGKKYNMKFDEHGGLISAEKEKIFD